MRLFTTTYNVTTHSQPLILPSHDPSRPTAMRFQLAIPFDLRVPGWLPPSHLSTMTNTSYGVVIHAVLAWHGTQYSAPFSRVPLTRTAPDPESKSSMKTHVNAFFPNHSLDPTFVDKPSSKFIPFTIHRHRFPLSVAGLAQNGAERHFILRPQLENASPVECVVTVPDWVDANGAEKSLKVSLRIRGRRSAVIEGTKAEVKAPAHASGQLSGQGGVGREALSGSVPTKRETRARRNEDEILTHLLELGMEVEEVERFT